jgi:hypothetical protein
MCLIEIIMLSLVKIIYLKLVEINNDEAIQFIYDKSANKHYITGVYIAINDICR